MEMWLSIVGFLVVVAIIVTIMTKKLSTMVALSVIPLVGAILVGGAADIPAYLTRIKLYSEQQFPRQCRHLILLNM